MSGGDATLRHNAGMDNVHSHARATGARPELERQGLLGTWGNRGWQAGGRRTLCYVKHLVCPSRVGHGMRGLRLI